LGIAIPSTPFTTHASQPDASRAFGVESGVFTLQANQTFTVLERWAFLAYYVAIQQFLAWDERAGYQDVEDIEPITVAAYIEILQRRVAPPTVKQHMAAIRMLFSWLTEKRRPGQCQY
jgi:site-specific recombinase XerD